MTRNSSFKRSRLGDISNRVTRGAKRQAKDQPKEAEKQVLERRSERTTRRASGNGRSSTPIRPGSGFELLSSDLLELIFQYCLWSVEELTSVARVCRQWHAGVKANLTSKGVQCKTDVIELNNPQSVVPYARDVYRFDCTLEARQGLSPMAGYMERQADLNEAMRAILIDWLVEVHLKFKFEEETLYLCVNLIDRYLSVESTLRSKLQLVGVTASFVACKYEETYPAVCRDFVYVSDHAYTREQILEMEGRMLHTLNYHLFVPSSLHFLQRYIKLSGLDLPPADLADASTWSPSATSATGEAKPVVGAGALTAAELSLAKFTARYLIELSLIDYKMLEHLPSCIAACAVYIGLLAIDQPPWTKALSDATGYSEAELQPCARKMHRLHADAKGSSLQAVRKKYLLAKHGAVSDYRLPPLPALGCQSTYTPPRTALRR